MVTNGDPKEQIFLSHPHTDNRFLGETLLILLKNETRKFNLNLLPEAFWLPKAEIVFKILPAANLGSH